MQSPVALVFKFSDWLQKKFRLQFIVFTVRIGSLATGVTDIDWNQHFKSKDFNISREEFLKELQEIAELEKEFE